MAINKVNYNGRTLIDLTEDTVTSETLLSGQTAHDKSGQAITGSLSMDQIQSGLAIIVDGDTASMAVPVGGYAYIKNNTHGLTEGLYKNTSSSAFPASGGTADGTVFTSVSRGGLNDLTLDGASAYGEVGPVAIASIQDALSLNAESLVVDIEPVQAGSGDPSPDNVRPIIGWTGAKVSRTGKNLAPVNTFVASHDIVMTFVPNLPAGVYTYSYKATRTGTDSRNGAIRFVYDDDTYIQEYIFVDGVRKTRTFTLKKPLASIYIYSVSGSYSDSGNYVLTATDFQITLGSTATPYEPYQGDIYNITFQTEAGTVYGGTLDVVNGVLTVDRYTHVYEGATDDVITARSYDNTNKCLSIRLAAKYQHIVSSNGLRGRALIQPMCDILPIIYFDALRDNTGNAFAAQGNWAPALSIQISGLTTVAEYDAWCAEHKPQISWKLATPITYQLTPQEVALLRGNNTIFADCGDTTVGFWRDDSLSINKAITERAYDKQQGEALADDVGALSAAMTYVVSGNKSIETATIPVGAYVRLVGSTISGRSDGIYTVAIAIPVNTVIDGTYFNESAPIPGGGLNALKASLTATVLLSPTQITGSTGVWHPYNLTDSIENYLMIIIYVGADSTRTQGSNVIINPTLNNAYNARYGNFDIAVKFTSNTSVEVEALGSSGWYVSIYGVMKLS